ARRGRVRRCDQGRVRRCARGRVRGCVSVRTRPLAPHWSGKCEACVGRSTKFSIFGSFCSCTRYDTVLHKGVSQRHPSNGRSGLLFGFLPPIAFLAGARVLPYLKRWCFHLLFFPS